MNNLNIQLHDQLSPIDQYNLYIKLAEKLPEIMHSSNEWLKKDVIELFKHSACTILIIEQKLQIAESLCAHLTRTHIYRPYRNKADVSRKMGKSKSVEGRFITKEDVDLCTPGETEIDENIADKMQQVNTLVGPDKIHWMSRHVGRGRRTIQQPQNSPERIEKLTEECGSTD